MKKHWLAALITLVIFIAAGFVAIRYYSYVFAKTVSGEIMKVERVTQTDAIISLNGQIPANQIYSFAVAIRDGMGEIHTASSEDRQWAVAQAGQCVEAKFYPYPIWDLSKSGTYFGARLLRLSDCKK